MRWLGHWGLPSLQGINADLQERVSSLKSRLFRKSPISEFFSSFPSPRVILSFCLSPTTCVCVLWCSQGGLSPRPNPWGSPILDFQPQSCKLNKCLLFIQYSASVLWYNHGKWTHIKVSFILWTFIISTKYFPSLQKAARFSMKYASSESDVVFFHTVWLFLSGRFVSTLSRRTLHPADVLGTSQLCQQRSLRQNRSPGTPNRDFLL